MTFTSKQINHNFFSTINEKSAYWAGFMLADACICKNLKKDKNTISIELSSKDISHIEKFKCDIQSEHSICTRNRMLLGRDKIYSTSSISFKSKQIKDDLENIFGVTCNKSSYCRLNTNLINDINFNHFLRGLFDGDGTFCVGENNAYRCIFLGTEDLLIQIKDYFINNNVFTDISNIRFNKGIYELTFSGRLRSDILLKYLYKNSVTYLERKHDIYIKYKNILGIEDMRIKSYRKSINRVDKRSPRKKKLQLL